MSPSVYWNGQYGDHFTCVCEVILETNRCTCPLQLEVVKWDKMSSSDVALLFLSLHYKGKKIRQSDGLSCLLRVFLHPSTFSSTALSHLNAASPAQMFIEWLVGPFDAISENSHHCSRVKIDILLGISRNRSDPPQRALGCFYFATFLAVGLLLSCSSTVGLIKRRTIRELNFNGLQVPLKHEAEWLTKRQ